MELWNFPVDLFPRYIPKLMIDIYGGKAHSEASEQYPLPKLNYDMHTVDPSSKTKDDSLSNWRHVNQEE